MVTPIVIRVWLELSELCRQSDQAKIMPLVKYYSSSEWAYLLLRILVIGVITLSSSLMFRKLFNYEQVAQ